MRCNNTQAGLPSAPVPGELGKLVLENACGTCWGEWLKAQVILINENRYTGANPEHVKALLGHMRAFLNLPAEDAG
ncbi:hypothetical protein ABI59_01145 [Acidobacteria bacterium Mor1]|nr:hypothetical protein ABI59_01145 [Acidobacteria bacterium Mor1]